MPLSDTGNNSLHALTYQHKSATSDKLTPAGSVHLSGQRVPRSDPRGLQGSDASGARTERRRTKKRQAVKVKGKDSECGDLSEKKSRAEMATGRKSKMGRSQVRKSKTVIEMEEERTRRGFEVKCLVKNGLNVQVMAQDEGIIAGIQNQGGHVNNHSTSNQLLANPSPDQATFTPQSLNQDMKQLFMVSPSGFESHGPSPHLQQNQDNKEELRSSSQNRFDQNEVDHDAIQVSDRYLIEEQGTFDEGLDEFLLRDGDGTAGIEALRKPKTAEQLHQAATVDLHNLKASNKMKKQSSDKQLELSKETRSFEE